MVQIPTEITDSLKLFRNKFPVENKVAFLMMQFGQTETHSKIVEAVRDAIKPYGFAVTRADDQQFHDDLYYNILTYLHGCGFGIAVFERLEDEYFNPNVSLEIGYMLGRMKQVCLLKDKTIKTLHTDLAGKLYRSFDPQDPIHSIEDSLLAWMRDKSLILPKDRKVPVRVELDNLTTRKRNDPTYRNVHELRILKHETRDPDFTYFKSTGGAPFDEFRVSFVFAIRNIHIYVNGRWKILIDDLLKSDFLSQHSGSSWLRYEPTENRWEGWIIDATALKREYPELSELHWLEGEHECRYQSGFDRPDEPKDTVRVTFSIQETGDPEQRALELNPLQAEILSFLNNHSSNATEKMIFSAVESEHKQEGYLGLHELQLFGLVNVVHSRQGKAEDGLLLYTLSDLGRKAIEQRKSRDQ